MGVQRRVVIGMDPHKRSVTVEVMEADETIVGRGRFGTDVAGFAQLVSFAGQWLDRVWAIEGCEGIVRHVAQRLLAVGEQVVDVPAKLSARMRMFATGQGRKTDDTDAHSIALVGVRIERWVMQLDNETLAAYGINMHSLSPTIQAKLREKAASYQDCMAVSRRLTWLAYGTARAPRADVVIHDYLEIEFGPIRIDDTVCLICRESIAFSSFANARRGRAEIETAHALPRTHDVKNVGFAHRPCNIAQGDKDLPAFYEWIQRILSNVAAEKGTPA